MSTTRPVIIDASVALALILGEPEAADIERAMRSWIGAGRTLTVPSHFWLEVANRLSRRPGSSGRRVLAAVHRLDSFGLTTEQPDRPLLLYVINLMERHRLTAYDANCLALAELLGADLATLDRDLRVAAGSRAVAFTDDHRLNEATVPYEHDVTWPRYKETSAYLARLRAEALAGRG